MFLYDTFFLKVFVPKFSIILQGKGGQVLSHAHSKHFASKRCCRERFVHFSLSEQNVDLHYIEMYFVHRDKQLITKTDYHC